MEKNSSGTTTIQAIGDGAVVARPIRTFPKSRLEGHEGILWIIAAGVMFATGVIKAINLVIVMAYIMFGLWVINFFIARRSLKGIVAFRKPIPPLFAGSTIVYDLEIQDSNIAVGGTAVLREKVDGAITSWAIVRSSEKIDVQPKVRITCTARGSLTIEPLRVSTSIPFGLYNYELELLPAQQLLVLPKPARIDVDRLRQWLFRAWAGRDEERQKINRVVEHEAEFHGLRDYRPGDSPRRVHWKSTARRQKLVVKEYEDVAPPRLILVVEAWLPSAQGASDLDQLRLERVLSLAAGVVRGWRRQPGARLVLLTLTNQIEITDGPAGPGITQLMLEKLAVVAGGSGSSGRLFDGLSRASLAAPVLVISSRTDSQLQKQVAQELGRPVAFSQVDQVEYWYRWD